MFDFEIPNYKVLEIDKLVFDYNGTLACDGIPVSGVKEKLDKLAIDFEIYVLTADTFGTVKKELKDVDVEIVIVDKKNGTKFKENFIQDLNKDSVIAVGNGNNDTLMLARASLGILILGLEGAATESLLKSDLIVRNINDVLDILLNPKRLVASLRK
ncbi:HAD family hydrolase [Selenihalanaerobacter shriftii]|uniref:Soluble P-type ATPase n=1 Tax=Selenihalanaerobacter shriftii TaxID=142842 RepID=A0A1T4QG75_9FIRM|nr:HAD family hydrolase [Selenihalanaerobacter shriftii]SKA02783.1 Soluble P-type ATPase [Selenihalanaerobacter shriftii]